MLLLSGVTKSREATVVVLFGVLLGFPLGFGVGVLDLSGVTKLREASVLVGSLGAFVGGLGVARSISGGAKMLGVGAPSKPSFED